MKLVANLVIQHLLQKEAYDYNHSALWSTCLNCNLIAVHTKTLLNAYFFKLTPTVSRLRETEHVTPLLNATKTSKPAI